MKDKFLKHTAKWFNCSTNLSPTDCDTLFQQAHLNHIQEAIEVVSTDNMQRVFQDFFGEQAQSLTTQQVEALSNIEIKLQGAAIDVQIDVPNDPWAKMTTKRAVGLYSYYHSSGQVREKSIVSFNLCSLWLLFHANMYFHEMSIPNEGLEPSQTRHGFFTQTIPLPNNKKIPLDLGNLLLFRLSNASQLGDKVHVSVLFKDYTAADIDTFLSLAPLLSAFNIPSTTLQLNLTYCSEISFKLGEVFTETSKRITALRSLGYTPNDQTSVKVNLEPLSIKIRNALDVQQHIQQRMQLTHELAPNDNITVAEHAQFDLFVPNILELRQKDTDSPNITSTLTIALTAKTTEKRQVALAFLAGITHFAEMHAAKGSIIQNTQLPAPDKKNLHDLSLYEFDLDAYTKLLPLTAHAIEETLPNVLIALYLHLTSQQQPLTGYKSYIELLADYAETYLKCDDHTYKIPAACYMTLEKLQSAQLTESETTPMMVDVAAEEESISSPSILMPPNSESPKIQLTLPDYPFEKCIPTELLAKEHLEPYAWLKQAPVLTAAEHVEQPEPGDIFFIRKIILGSNSEENGLHKEITRLFQSIDTELTLPANMVICDIPAILYGGNTESDWTYASGIVYTDLNRKDIAYKAPAGSDKLIGQTDPETRKRIFETMKAKAGRPRTTKQLAGKIVEKSLKLKNKIPVDISTKAILSQFATWSNRKKTILWSGLMNIDANLLEPNADRELKKISLEILHSFEMRNGIEGILETTIEDLTDTYLHQFISEFFTDEPPKIRNYYIDECKRVFKLCYEQAKLSKTSLGHEIIKRTEYKRPHNKRTSTKTDIISPYNLVRLIDMNEVLIYIEYGRVADVFVNCRLNKYGRTPGLPDALACANTFKNALELLPVKQEGTLPARPQVTYLNFFEPLGKAIRTKTLAELICRVLPYEIEAFACRNESHKIKSIITSLLDRYKQLREETQQLIDCESPVNDSRWEACATNWLILRDQLSLATFESMLKEGAFDEQLTETLKQYYETSNDSVATKIAFTIRLLTATGHPDFTPKPSIRNFARSQLENMSAYLNASSLLRPQYSIPILTQFIQLHPNESRLYNAQALLGLYKSNPKEAMKQMAVLISSCQLLKSTILKFLSTTKTTPAPLAQPPLAQPPQGQQPQTTKSKKSQPAKKYDLGCKDYLPNDMTLTKIAYAPKTKQLTETVAAESVTAMKNFIKHIVPLHHVFSLAALQRLFYGNRYKSTLPETVLIKELTATSCVTYDNSSKLFTRIQHQDEITTPCLEHFMNATWLGCIRTYLAKRWSGNLPHTTIMQILLLVDDKSPKEQVNFKYRRMRGEFNKLKERLKTVHKARIIAIKEHQPLHILPPDKLKSAVPVIKSEDQECYAMLCESLKAIQQTYASSIIARLKAVLNNKTLKEKYVKTLKLAPTINVAIKFLEQQKFPFDEFIPSEEDLPGQLSYASWDHEPPGASNPRNQTELPLIDWQRSPASLLFFILNACLPRELTQIQTLFSRKFAKVANDYQSAWEKLIEEEQETNNDININSFLNRYRFIALLFLNPISLSPDNLMVFSHDILLSPLLAISPPQISAMTKTANTTPLNNQLDTFITKKGINDDLMFYTPMVTCRDRPKDKSDINHMASAFEITKLCKEEESTMQITFKKEFCEEIADADLPPLMSVTDMLDMFNQDKQCTKGTYNLAKKFNGTDLQSELQSALAPPTPPSEKKSRKRRSTAQDKGKQTKQRKTKAPRVTADSSEDEYMPSKSSKAASSSAGLFSSRRSKRKRNQGAATTEEPETETPEAKKSRHTEPS